MELLKKIVGMPELKDLAAIRPDKFVVSKKISPCFKPNLSMSIHFKKNTLCSKLCCLKKFSINSIFFLPVQLNVLSGNFSSISLTQFKKTPSLIFSSLFIV